MTHTSISQHALQHERTAEALGQLEQRPLAVGDDVRHVMSGQVGRVVTLSESGPTQMATVLWIGWVNAYPVGIGSLEHFDQAPSFNDLIADLVAKGYTVTFHADPQGVWCQVCDYDEEAYYGAGIGLSAQLALRAALEDGGPW